MMSASSITDELEPARDGASCPEGCENRSFCINADEMIITRGLVHVIGLGGVLVWAGGVGTDDRAL